MKTPSPPPMKTREENRIDALDALQQSMFDLIKGLPFKGRLAQGLLMALQAVASASLAYGIGLALHTEQAFWAAITAIAVTQNSYSDTMHLSRDQFIGAIAGGLVGFAGAMLGGGPGATHASLHFAIYMASVAIVIAGCWCFNMGSAARLAAITTTIVLLVPAIGPAWNIALVRFAEVTLGTVCALAVCWVTERIERRGTGAS